jgi:hypothetical protein
MTSKKLNHSVYRQTKPNTWKVEGVVEKEEEGGGGERQ